MFDPERSLSDPLNDAAYELLAIEYELDTSETDKAVEQAERELKKMTKKRRKELGLEEC